MKTKVMVIRDVKVEAYMQPFTAQSIGIAERSFQDAMNNPNKDTDISKHPEDFELYCIGTYDDAMAKVEGHEPQFIMKGAK